MRTKQHFFIKRVEGNKTKLRDINNCKKKKSTEEKNDSFSTKEITGSHMEEMAMNFKFQGQLRFQKVEMKGSTFQTKDVQRYSGKKVKH